MSEVEQSNIRSAYLDITTNLREWSSALTELQKTCPHPEAKKVPRCGGGGWSTKEHYYHEVTCPDCRKYWHEDQ